MKIKKKKSTDSIKSFRIVTEFNPATESWSAWFHHDASKRFQGGYEQNAIEFLLMSQPEKGWKLDHLVRDEQISGPYHREYLLDVDTSPPA
ncbi:MAG: hypothetical protein KDA65_03090 [Planctomycetaceae bacterium]|nr:hypothetical protein [Planctomycetaceae bacterium]